MNSKRCQFWWVSACLLRTLVLVAFSLLLCVRSAASVESPVPKSDSSGVESLFRSGNEKFREGLELAKSDRGAADAKFREAAGAWREVARTGDISNAQLECNIANASLLGGDVAGAILAYKRALAIDPTNASAKAGLAAARRSAGTEALALGNATESKDNPGSAGGVRGTINALGSVIARAANRATDLVATRTLLVAGAVCYVAFFVGASLRLLGWLRVSGYALFGLAACFALLTGPVVLRELRSSRQADAVVFASNTVARSGPADLYDPAFQEPLRPGLEVEILEVRGSWSEVRLRDGRTAWVRSDAVERV